MTHSTIKGFKSSISVLFFGISLTTYSQGGLLITPKRVVFEGNKQKEEITLMNTGTDTATYSISLRNYNMSEQGRLVLIEKPDTIQMFADHYLRFLPRQVTLPPGEAQVVMVYYRRRTDMKSGEYRSHLWFRDEKNYKALGEKKQVLDTNQLSVSVTAIYGMTIPVIIRTGKVNVGSTLSGLGLEMQQDTIPYLNLTVNRTGNISINGKLTAEYIPEQGKPYEIGSANVVIYTNLMKRDISLKLNKAPGKSFKNGKVKVLFTSRDVEKPVVYAEAEIAVE
jgi:hypothetical protein